MDFLLGPERLHSVATIVLSSHSMVPPKHGISKNTSVSATGMLHHQQALLASLQELTLPLGTKLQLLFMIQSWGSHRNEGFTQTNGLSWFLMTSNLTLSFLWPLQNQSSLGDSYTLQVWLSAWGVAAVTSGPYPLCANSEETLLRRFCLDDVGLFLVTSWFSSPRWPEPQILNSKYHTNSPGRVFASSRNFKNQTSIICTVLNIIVQALTASH